MKNCKKHTRKNVKIKRPVVLLKIMKQQYPNAPKRSQLIDELIREFLAYSEFPEKAVITVNNHYSRKLIRNVLRELGYEADNLLHHLTSPTKILKIKE